MDSSQNTKAAWALLGNVSINVVANLVATAFVYLGGTLIGLFPREPAAIATAIVIILLAGAWLPLIAFRLVNDKMGGMLIASGQTVLAGAVLVAQFTGVDLKPLVNSWLFWGMPVTLVVLSWVLQRRWDARRRRIAAARKIKDLSWYELPGEPHANR